MDAGNKGISGSIDVLTGESSAGSSGYINLQTGDAYGPRASSRKNNGISEKAGYIHFKVGTSDMGVGGDIKMFSGSTTTDPGRGWNQIDTTGGAIEMQTGFSHKTNSGDFLLSTTHAGK